MNEQIRNTQNTNLHQTGIENSTNVFLPEESAAKKTVALNKKIFEQTKGLSDIKNQILGMKTKKLSDHKVVNLTNIDRKILHKDILKQIFSYRSN